MTAIPKISALFESSLASSLSASGASFTLVSATDRDGTALSGLYGFIIDEGTADEEFCTGTVASTTVTISKRGCDADAPETEVTVNKKAHRRGASVKITDYPIMAYLRNAIAGDTGYELPAQLKLALGVGDPTDDNHLVRKAYADRILSGGTGVPNRVVVSGTAGETVAAGNLVYLKASDDRWWKASASTASTVENIQLGIAQGSGTAGTSIGSGVMVFGVDSNQSGLTIDTKCYAGNTAGSISSSAGTTQVGVGFALSATSLLFIPRFDQQLTKGQQDALAGASGTAPSSSNKFVDQALLASTSAAGIVEEATQAEVDAGTAAGSIGRLFKNPSTPSKYSMGVLPALYAKTYFNIQLPFLNWTGSTSGAATTDFPNWIFTTEAVPLAGGAMTQFAGTGAESAQIITGVFASSGAAKLNWADTNIIIMDWWAKLPASSTGDIQMGIADSIAALNSLFNANTDNKATFAQSAAGALYATISKVGVGVSTTDISSGITTTNWNNYRVEFHGGTDAKFYVNGILKATLSGANLPSAATVLGVGFGRSNTATFAVTAPNFSLQLI